MKLKEIPNLEQEENRSENANAESDKETTGPEQVKNLLLKQLNNYKNNKNRYTINADAVTKFRIIGNEAYCVVNCPFCAAEVPCTLYICIPLGNQQF